MALNVVEDSGKVSSCMAVVDSFELFDALFSAFVDLVFRLTLI